MRCLSKKAELAELDQQLADLVLKSPVDGTVGTIVLRQAMSWEPERRF